MMRKILTNKKVFLKRLCATALTVCLITISMTGCGNGDDSMISETLASSEVEDETRISGAGEGQTANAKAAAEDIIVVSEMFTDRDLNGEYDASKAERITLSGSDVTIAKEGVYLLSGSLTDGMIIIDADDSAKVQLVLDGVDINNSTNAAIYVKQADKVFITLAEGSNNSLTSGGYTVLDGNNIDGVIFAKSDLTINGMGSLTVNAVQGHGIVTKDDLKLTGGEVTVMSADHGLSGKDSVRVTNCTLLITSGKDGIHSENSDKEEKGFVYLADGTIHVTSEGDGISASSVIQIDGGTIAILAGGGSANKSIATDENKDTVSTKGIKASGELLINQGTIDIDSQDDAIHSNSDVVINGGNLSLATGDDGIHGDEAVRIRGGNINISTSYEGIEGTQVEISGGNISLYATDDGLNAAGGRDQSGFGGMFGGGERFGGRGRGGAVTGDTSGNPFGESSGDTTGGEDPYILISGGTIHVRADGDGLDSNGTLTVTGGEVYVSGPQNGANGAIDYETSGQITGGTVVAVGTSAMAMNFGDSSTQGSIMITTSNHASGTEITLKDASGKELVRYTSECSFNSVVISCPELVLGGTYTITAGEESTEVTLSDSLIYGSGFGGGGFGGGGMMPGGNRGGGGRMPGGQMPEGMEMPEGGQMPEGMEIPEGGQMPEGMEIPEGGQMPEGMEVPEGGMQNGGQMPGGGMFNGMNPGRR